MSESSLLSGRDNVSERLRAAAEFEPAELPRLRYLAEEWAEAAATRIKAIAGSSFDFTLREIDIDFAPDLEAEEAADTLFATLNSSRFRHPGYVSLDHAVVEALIAIFFAAEPSPVGGSPREPTDFDRGLVKLAVSTISEAIDPIFADIATIRLSAGDLGGPSDLAVHLGDDPERFVLFRFQLRVAALGATMTFGLPSNFFAPHRRFLREAPDLTEVDRDESWSEAIKTSFAKSDLRLAAVLSKKKVSLGTIAGFKVGATFPLEIGANSLIALECEDRPLFRARMGRSGGSYVVRVEERVDPAEEFIDDILSD